MKIKFNLLLVCIFISSAISLKAQTSYFPPISGNSWDTLSPQSLGWCQSNIQNLYTYLDSNDTKAFIILKDGKIVLEKYFDGFTTSSVWYWASAGKSLTAFLVGLAQEQGFLNISDTVSDYLGQGWTSCTPQQEEKITIRHLLEMTSGLDDAQHPDCNMDSCLTYKADAGTRWSYHSAAYSLLHKIIENASGTTINALTTAQLKNLIGMSGVFVDVADPNQGVHNVYYSDARSMARFGLLMQHQGNWDGNQIMTDANYFHDMTNSAQSINPAYGYLWWLNGQTSFMVPGLQIHIQGELLPDAPSDMIMAMGKNGQFIDIDTSQNLVLIRMGDAPTSVLVPYMMNDSIWKYVNLLPCGTTSTIENIQKRNKVQIMPNPVENVLGARWENAKTDQLKAVFITTLTGEVVKQAAVEPFSNQLQIGVSALSEGIYLLYLRFKDKAVVKRFIKQ